MAELDGEQKEGEEAEEHKYRDRETQIYNGLLFGLGRHREYYDFERGYKLNRKPREIDCVIIRKKNAGPMPKGNGIEKIFRSHNIVEFKNAREPLNIDTVWKVISYAAQYKSEGRWMDEIPIEEVTITFLRLSKPRKLLSYLKEHGYEVRVERTGIYYVSGLVGISMQIVDGTKLEGDKYLPLRVQRKNADNGDISKFLEMIGRLKDDADREMAEGILSVSIEENRELYARLMKEGDKAMRENILRILNLDEQFHELQEGMRIAQDEKRKAQDEKRKAQDEKRKAQEGERKAQELLSEEKQENTRMKENMTLWMLRKNIPINEICEVTKMDRERIAEIAKSIGVSCV